MATKVGRVARNARMSDKGVGRVMVCNVDGCIQVTTPFNETLSGLEPLKYPPQARKRRQHVGANDGTSPTHMLTH